MVLIGYDRHNVIVKGLTGTKLTHGKAILMVIMVWLYSAGCALPPVFGWGGSTLGMFA